MAIIPSQNKKWTGIFEGEFFGAIWLCKNIDLRRNLGKVVLGEALTSKFDSDNDGDLSVPVAFVRTAADSTDRWWALGGKLFKSTNTDPEAGWAQDAIGSSPTAPLYDMIEFLDDLWVAKSTNLDKLSGGTWSTGAWSALSGGSVLQSGVPHRFAIFAGAMLVTDGRYINWHDGTLTEDPALTLPTDFQSQFIGTTADFAFIGTKNVTGGEAEVFFWNRSSDTFNNRYGIGDTEALCGFTIDGIPHIVTKRGWIKKFTGFGFRTVQQFPSVEVGKDITDINPNGVLVEGREVLMNVNFGVITDKRLLSGIWVYNVDTGNLTHRNSVRNDSGNDYSQQEVPNVGAIALTSPTQGRYLIGSDAYKVYTGTKLSGIYTSDEDSTSGQRGYIITPKLSAQGVANFEKELTIKIREFANATDRIRTMYKTQEDAFPAYETITWVNATSFTGTNTDVAVNDFVEIIAGDNAGAIAKIITITGSGTLTFTIDQTLNASTNAARARYLKWIDQGDFSVQNEQDFTRGITTRAPWVQIFVELDGKVSSPELEGLLIPETSKKR